ncbi:hypothetical protein V462_11325 [Pantoea ananatis 15320]|uniref:hypothetical protein n=1 Tax=Pantoea ananas TaxID=553 RepID=UPI001EE53B2D|nr:hypothetical protein [Pantoea ananatis]PKC35772.1 hypothetical protein V462_11325 [Pantoea ananatis 15320]
MKTREKFKNIIEKTLRIKAVSYSLKFLTNKKGILFTFSSYLAVILAMAIISPYYYMFAFLPLLFSIVIYVKTPQKNEKFLKDINDTTLYIFASCKVFSLAVQSTDERWMKDLLNNFENTNFVILSWLIIIMCTYLKTIICGHDSYRFIKKIKDGNKSNNDATDDVNKMNPEIVNEINKEIANKPNPDTVDGLNKDVNPTAKIYIPDPNKK